ncbi:MAG TPA: hypothetical protein VIL41_06610 [Coriobacteriia bacterium]
MDYLPAKGRVFIVLLAVLSLAAFVVPAQAIAPDQVDWDHATTVTVPFSVSTVFTPTGLMTWYSVEATAGQTVQVLATTPGAGGGIMMGTFDDPYTVEGSPVSLTAVRLSFMAPRTQRYLLAVSSDTSGACSVTATLLTAAQPFTLASMTSPGSPRHGRSFTVSAKSFPAYNSVRSPIRFMVDRKSGKRWKAYGTVVGAFTSQFLTGGSSKSTASLKLAKKGTYRVRARLIDAAHPVARYSSWRTIKVK